MPIQVKCGGCGTILVEFNGLPPKSDGRYGHQLSPAQFVINQNGGHCPKCGKKLEIDINKQQVDVSAFNPYMIEVE